MRRGGGKRGLYLIGDIVRGGLAAESREIDGVLQSVMNNRRNRGHLFVVCRLFLDD